jgi:hypothetical protein
MEMQPVESSNIKAIGHDPETSTLRVEFKNGGIYEFPASAEDHAALMASPSKGKHFYKHFRGKVPAQKVA